MSQKSAPLPQGATLLTPPVQFRKEVTKSVAAIVGFIAVYFLLFGLSLLLVGLCFYAGIFIISSRISLYTLLFSLGLIGCGVMIFVFLIKFLFASTKTDNSDSIEITEEDQPALFKTIYELAEQTGTPKPKKVFLSGDVNAAVFYDSSFWSLFFPVRKNLKVGLGLVNAVNISELKAVIAHEFGHFSQRSMKVGSWAYQVNKIIYDMLFNNRGFANSLDSMAGVHGIVTLLVLVTVKMVQAIQWVLHQMFKVVNKSYLGLSRQMEFHADLVAASVSGSNNIISALRRIEFAHNCYTTTLDACNLAWKENNVAENFYSHHRAVVSRLATLDQLNLINGLPVLKDDEESGIGPRVNYSDQWASHPTLRERMAHLAPFDLSAAVESAPAWSLFINKKDWEEKLTRLVYRDVANEDIKGHMDDQQFEALLAQQLQVFSYPPVFKGFYNNRVIDIFDPEAAVQSPFVPQPFEAILTEEAVLLPKRLQYLQQDIAVLQSISKKEIVVTSFDFDGQKFNRREAEVLLVRLEEERKGAQESLTALDRALFRYFYAILPLAEAEKLKEAYRHYFDLRGNAEVLLDEMNAILRLLAPVFRGQTLTLEAIQGMIAKLKREHEPAFRKELNDWDMLGAFAQEETVKKAVEKFILTRCAYFSGTSLFDSELIELRNLVHNSWNSIHNHVLAVFKSITEKQAASIETKKQELIQ